MKNKIASFSVTFIVLSLVLINISAFISQHYGRQQTPINIMGAQINSKLELFLNSVVIIDSEMITVEFDDVINVTVFYRDLESGNHIPNATVELVGWGILNETNNHHYNITINANDLKQEITLFTVSAAKENYQPQSINFLIEVVEKSSQLQLFLDSIDKTNDPIYEITINEFLNITVKYTDNESQHITDATIKLIGEGLTLNFTEQVGLEQYYLSGGLNTTDLGIGVKFLTIFAYAPNFSIKTIELRITIHRINVTISRADGDPQIEVYVGEDVLLNIILKDPYNNTISGAIVTYTWAYGVGELDDSDNDGIYNGTLHTVQIGVYKIKIIAFAGEDYTFQEYELTLIVSSLPPFTLTSNADPPDTDGSFTLMWNNTNGADNYSVYQYDKNITEINGSLTFLANEITDLILPLNGYVTGIYYFIVVAHNKEGDNLSNCIKIIVSLPPPGYFILWSNATIPDVDGEFDLLWSNSSGADYYTVYQYDKYITEINGSLTPLTEQTPDLSLFLNNYLDGTYYFIVVSHNDYGDTLSNCFQIIVLREKISPEIPGYNLFFVITILNITIILLFKKRIKYTIN